MENTTLILILITNLMLVIFLGFFGFLIYRLIKDRNNPNQNYPAPGNYHPDILARMKEVKSFKRMDLFCPNHPEEPGEVSCGICDKLFCKSCIRPYKSLHFCLEHLPLVMNHQWGEVLTIKTSTHDPERGVRVYDTKKKVFEEMNLPTYVETHYKINIDHDHIETYLVVFAMNEQVGLAKSHFLE